MKTFKEHGDDRLVGLSEDEVALLMIKIRQFYDKLYNKTPLIE
jgi:hypothetical protein